MITYRTFSLAEANLMLDAAQKKAEELGVPQVLCVADAAGYPIALRRLDGGKVTSVQIAMNKAFTAAGHRKPTHAYKNAYPGEEAFGIFTQHEGRFTVFVGGFPVVVDGQVVGAIAASGGNGEQDTAVCNAGIEAFMKHFGR
ncbi:MAG TPA: heme-binding protein [Candidatus Sulfotelmatobacter sp.]|nr:heme-binding protein [Candidatus Sulfotelmatobacter sp.]